MVEHFSSKDCNALASWKGEDAVSEHFNSEAIYKWKPVSFQKY